MIIQQRDTEVNWAQLDESNAAHYARNRRPDWVRQAEEASTQADEIHTALIDRYLDNTAEWDAVSEAERYTATYYEYAGDCRQSWHSGFTMPKYNLNYYLKKQGLSVEQTDSEPACYGLPD